jgi:electron transport complex protein RnfG
MNHKQGTGLMVLLAVAATAALTISLLEQRTRERIAANEAARALQVVAEVLPAGSYDNEPHLDTVQLLDEELLGRALPQTAYIARAGRAGTAVALTITAPDGYVAPLRLLVGIDAGGTIVNARVLQHQETPGLGDKVETTKSDWITGFSGAQLAEPASLTLQRDGGQLDHISGATITSRAVARALTNALRYFDEHSKRLLAYQTGQADTPAEDVTSYKTGE